MNDLLLPLPAPQGEHLSACLVMVDLVGSTVLAHRLPLEHYAALMAEFVQLLILSFEARRGQVLQHQGDAVLALWSAAHTSEAVRAALEAHERAARLGLAGLLGVRLQVRAGVALGPVITGPVGGQPSAYGLPVNYARRLCDAAAPGETLVCERVAQQRAEDLRMIGRSLPPLRGFGPECRAYTVQSSPALVLSPMKTG
ncbi:adenylate/guanylate cyclase domain-containing protein [Deinococcus sp. YIM 77859]|uniref:adenylate/guanylate cyclase domain-containing protein n=1 Tax=Deinococcus sp. YIM 77859 TaxID=1540221 RepID=UPI00069253A2|nr:adenylate/guanylate cyclase domain-containing protein [Deinococcus sp. YIM 77859]